MLWPLEMFLKYLARRVLQPRTNCDKSKFSNYHCGPACVKSTQTHRLIDTQIQKYTNKRWCAHKKTIDHKITRIWVENLLQSLRSFVSFEFLLHLLPQGKHPTICSYSFSKPCCFSPIPLPLLFMFSLPGSFPVTSTYGLAT